MHEELARLSELIQPARSIAVLVSEVATVDQVAAALALVQSLRLIGKDVTLYAPKIPQLPIALAGLNEIKTEFGKQNLVISFDYQESLVDKVSYAISQDASKFFLTIRPKKGSAPLDPATVEFSYAGTDCELIVLFGEHDLTNLQQLYFGYEEVYASTPIITFNTFNPGIGAIAMDVSAHSSYSEYLTLALGGMQLELNSDVATNLYIGLALETKAFTSPQTTAETFEVAAELLRRGARRGRELQSALMTVSVQNLSAVKQSESKIEVTEANTTSVRAKAAVKQPVKTSNSRQTKN